MIPKALENDWDFSPVIDLIYSLSIAEEDDPSVQPIYDAAELIPAGLKTSLTIENGHEDGLQLGNFDKIWQYLSQDPNHPSPTFASSPETESVEVVGKNVINEQLSVKEVRWRDELQGAELVDGDGDDDDDKEYSTNLSHLTKAQRKKARRKQRRAALDAGLQNVKSLPSESENESEKDMPAPRAPDRKAVIYEILHETLPQATSTGFLRSGKVFRSQGPTDVRDWPVVSTHLAKHVAKIREPTVQDQYAVEAAKKADLMNMLRQIYIDERPFLDNISYSLNIAQGADHNPEGIHVFIDASNILIGFHDALKLARGQPRSHRIRRQPISFHNLSLVLERGRPAAKRILVGSDNFPAMQEAKRIGYETNILERVHKAKEITPRQKKYGNRNNTSASSGSETTAAQFAPEKWVEQAVDEILHLKMMESVVDAREPSTMVLATGDAAEAEYSGGFMKMVERALGKGWKIELASFQHNMSNLYKRREFRQQWGQRFKIIELDDFVELLLGVE